MSAAARAYARARDHVQVTRQARAALIGSALVTAALFAIPFGGFLIYPLLLLSTLAHELGHGLAALLTGGEFRDFYLWPDGSGMAVHSAAEGALRDAFVSAGGLVGPALVAALAFVLARRPAVARLALAGLALVCFALDVLVVRNSFALAYVGVVGVLLLGFSRARPALAQGALVFFAVQLALSVFSRADYLFTPTAITAAGAMPSDSAQIAAALGGSYWLWGAACGLFSVLVLVLGLWLFVRGSAQVGLAALRSRA